MLTQQEIDEWGCNCVGPKRGEPLCPCEMQDVKIINGRYVRTVDLGPVTDDWYFDNDD